MTVYRSRNHFAQRPHHTTGSIGRGYDRPHDDPGVGIRSRLGRLGRDAVPRPSGACGSGLWPTALSRPGRVRNVRHTGTVEGQRHPGLPRLEWRRACSRFRGSTGGGEHTRWISRRRARRRPWNRPGLVGRHDRSRQGVRHESLLRRQLQSPGRMRRDDWPFVYEPAHGPVVRIRLSRHYWWRTWCAWNGRS